VVRRRLTIKRIDPWSVLKFGAVINVVLLAIFLLVSAVVWFIIDRLQLVDQACAIATDVGFTACGVDAGNLFRALSLLGALWVIVQTAVFVFFAFLHNLIADLTGGLIGGTVEEGTARPSTARNVTTSTTPPARDGGSRSQPVRSEQPPASAARGGGGSPATSTRPQQPVGARSEQDGSDEELFGERR
jgi:hypothetical protein